MNHDEYVDDVAGEAFSDDSAELAPAPGAKGRGLPRVPAGGADVATSKDLLQSYLADVRRYALLDPEEERETALRYYESGDPAAAERLVTSNLRLVVKIAFQYHRQWANVLDLIQEGNVGLVEALSRFDPYRGIRFSSYAQYWIRALILKFLMENYRLLNLGKTRNGRKLFFGLQRERAKLLQDGIDATAERLAEALSVPVEEVRALEPLLGRQAVSLDQPVSDDEGSRRVGETISDPAEALPDELVAIHRFDALLKEKLDHFASTLVDEREVAIWHERLVAAEKASLSDLGRRYDVSKERIRQIEARMMDKLRIYLRDERVEVL